MTFPTPTPPCLGEREAVARTEELLKNRLPLRCHCDSCRAQLVKDLVEAANATLRAENETLRARIEKAERARFEISKSYLIVHETAETEEARRLTAEAERDAAIARAEELQAIIYNNLKSKD